MSILVSIGRNIGAEPMSDQEWSAFRAGTTHALADTVGAPDTEHTGGGVWQGVREESAVFTVFDPTLAEYPTLARRLAELADAFSQDAIALTTGTVDFVSAEDYAEVTS